MMSDLISRKAAIEALKRAEALTRAFGYHHVIDTIRELPTAEPSTTIMKVEVGVDKESLRKAMEEAELTLLPAEKKGRWVYDEERGATGIYAICTACNEMIYQTGEFNYCPNCGARMEE